MQVRHEAELLVFRPVSIANVHGAGPRLITMSRLFSPDGVVLGFSRGGFGDDDFQTESLHHVFRAVLNDGFESGMRL